MDRLHAPGQRHRRAGVSLPLGFDAPTGMPIGVMLSADLGRGRALLDRARQSEPAAPFRRIQDQT